MTTAFGVPGAAINPFYDAMRRHGGIKHYRRGTWKGPRTWRKATPAPPPAISACASAPPARRAPT
ncbi:hypothetical protein M5585_25165 [Serratia ureilytica]